MPGMRHVRRSRWGVVPGLHPWKRFLLAMRIGSTALLGNPAHRTMNSARTTPPDHPSEQPKGNGVALASGSVAAGGRVAGDAGSVAAGRGHVAADACNLAAEGSETQSHGDNGPGGSRPQNGHGVEESASQGSLPSLGEQANGGVSPGSGEVHRPTLLSASMDRTMMLWRPDVATGMPPPPPPPPPPSPTFRTKVC